MTATPNRIAGTKRSTSLRKRVSSVFALGLASVAAAATIQVAVSGPASAHYDVCPANNLCVWEHMGYNGGYQLYEDVERRLYVDNIGVAFNDKTTSMWNRTNRRICFYDNTLNSDVPRELLCLEPGGSEANVGDGKNDRISAFQPS